ncbi:NADH-quinone oxidoreductase subunit NuoN [Telmatospirillum sp. J64-1]|uniref:NADH-quinone oxidoreductase subunit NuoN n=1 Tax=Telmatospirillum sp. J64-1 TaxID=2502183 RepID=UPI00115DF81D|nr:NADH-quinone oxidoreductase subunit NuoN [Telmatospirillum sp. J64-1]
MELNILPARPEIFIALSTMALMMIGVFRKDQGMRLHTLLAVGVMAVAGLLVLFGTGERDLAFGGLFIADGFAVYTKILVLIAAAVSLVMSVGFIEREKIERFEYPVLVLFATLGMMMMISANDLMSLYMGLELQSLSLYILAAYHRDNSRATEAGLKYFVLGALASGLLLYGASLVYGFAGSTSFDVLAETFASGEPHVGVVVGLVFVLAGLAFKISAVPFHMWTPDVYEGAPTPVTAFFAVAPKIAAMALLVRVMIGPFGDMIAQWQQVIIFVAAASMIVGSFAAITQTNIKRLMAYSSIGHVGYALMGLAAGSELGVRGLLVYLAIYLFMNVGAFAIILSMRQKGRALEGINDLAGLSKTNPAMALAMAVLMFSMAGIPPMAGFWSKFYVFLAAIEANLITLAVIGVLTSVVGAYYYLRIIKVMYFDEPTEVFDRPVGRTIGVVTAASTILVLVFTFIPAPLVDSAGVAAAALFPG